MNTDMLLRISSGLVFFLTLHQMFFSKGGILRHQIGGYATVVCGVVISILVTIRGSQSSATGVMYSLHLIAGGIFFLSLIFTGITGFGSRKNKGLFILHKSFALIFSGSLLFTLLLGIISKFSH